MEARGEVSGAKGSYDNGSPNITGDITIAVDVSNTSADYLSNVKANIATLVEDLKVRGIDYNLRLVTFGGDEPVTNANFGKNADALIAAIPDTPNAGTSNDFADVVNAVNSNSYAEGANKYLMVFTGESINGNGEIADDITISEYISILNKNGIAVSVATDPIYHNEGDAGERGWNIIAERTGGKLYSSTADTDFDILVKSISSDINKDINTKIASVPDNLNIISSVRKQLNALINIMAREVNRLHLSGKTLTGSDGGFFFEPIEPNLPIELGNIKISDALRDLNNIAASSSDANGDNKIALAIANLRNSNLMTGNKKILSLDTYYQNIIMDLGNKGYEAGTMAESYRNLVTQADSNRQSVMGVSLDEEMTNLLKYKFAYNANAKVIDAVNQMLETIMFRMGAS